ncbi:tetratricopeptide repeat-containing sensor histidine kinase [Emticicia aquatica]|nr:tetratricopeptide repeat-containing sensor histidine kinase [Emticicia aquatica]
MPKDTNYVRTAERYVWQLMNPLDDVKKADSVIKETEKLALKIKDYEGYARLHWYAGLLKYRNIEPYEALKYIEKVEVMINKYHLSNHLLQKVYTLYGSCYNHINEFEKALKYYYKAIELTEKYNLREYITQAYLGVYEIYQISDMAKALTYIKKIQEATYKDTDYSMRFLGEHALFNYGIIIKDFNYALEHLKKSEHFAIKYCRKSMIINCWVGYGHLYAYLNNLDEGLVYLYKAKKLAEELNIDVRKAQVYGGLGHYFLLQKKYKESEMYFLKMLELSKKDNFGLGQKEVYEVLSEIAVKTNNYRKAYNYQSLAHTINDSLFSSNLASKINKLEKEKQDANIKVLELSNKNSVFQRNIILFTGILSLMFAIVIIILILNRNKLKRFKEEQILRNRIAADLHDEIGSTLSSISILSELVAYQQKKGDFEPEIMQQVSNDSREVIDKMDDIIWTINPENDAFYNLETRLKSFAIPLFESKDIEFKFEFSPELESVKIDMGKRRDIYLILKEAINNLIKYSQCKNAIIQGTIFNNKLIMSVIDDGIGFETNANLGKNGQKNIKNRAKKIGGRLLVDSIIGKGTLVKLEITL